MSTDVCSFNKERCLRVFGCCVSSGTLTVHSLSSSRTLLCLVLPCREGSGQHFMVISFLRSAHNVLNYTDIVGITPQNGNLITRLCPTTFQRGFGVPFEPSVVIIDFLPFVLAIQPLQANTLTQFLFFKKNVFTIRI